VGLGTGLGLGEAELNPELCPLAWWVGVPAGEAPGLMRVPPGILLN